MLASSAEIDQTLQMITRAKASLDDERIPYNRSVRIGGMIEVPAAALALDVFLRKLDFLSIGTNDLIQYTLAIDRADESVAYLYDPLHPAVLTLVSGIIRRADKAGDHVRRNGGRCYADAVAAGHGAAQFFDARGARAGCQTAGAVHRHGGTAEHRSRDAARERSGAA
jgi:signal transduction protein with GAF and PtsI domain